MSDLTAIRRVVLRSYPDGRLRAEDFAVETAPAAPLGEGEFRVRNRWISVDPMLRLFVSAKPLGGELPRLPPGAVIPGAAVGEITESRHDGYRVGEIVEGRFGWQTEAVSKGAGVQRVAPALGPIEDALYLRGLPGFTAYVGLQLGGGIKPGQTVLVSGAAGAVGSVAGPLIKARGARAVGIAAGEAKRRYLLETAGYEAVADRTAPDFADQLARALPNGADVYFDNVGGPLLAVVAKLMARGGRVLICGLMAQYQGVSNGTTDHLPAVLEAIMARGLSLQSFSQFGQDALRPAFNAEISALVRSGALKSEIHVEHGLAQLPAALCGLFNRSVAGKVLVRVAETD